MSAKPREIDLWDHGPLRRADGHKAYNSYWWPLKGDDFWLGGRYRGGWHLCVVPLNNGHWLAEPPGCHTYSRQFPTRHAALRTAIAHTLKSHRKGWNRTLRKPGPAELATASAWIFDILVREIGPKRRWKWRRALGRAVALQEAAHWRITLTQGRIKDDARRRVGEAPRKGKLAIAEFRRTLAAAEEAASDRYDGELTRDTIRFCHRALRVEKLRAMRP
ncbi:MAG TPA: hypothetical protein VL358_04825 [Caulobacteraceae bacterium]|jgi:hypothetical protein|nr:hypothetical protein [Caulobacteraceae bacterium]